jgi:isopenicillin-N epimerase
VVGWGWGEDRQITYGSDFLDYLQYLGTNDLSAYFAVADAIQFRKVHRWEQVQAACHALLQQALEDIGTLTRQGTIYPNGDAYSQMAIASLPPATDLLALKTKLYTDYKVEVPLTSWQDQKFIRVSVQGYNTPSDIEVLLEALAKLLP